MKKSKYLNLQSGDWKCTYAGVDRVQPVYTQKRDAGGKKIRSKRAGHRSYYYIFERLTSDAKAMKMIRLGSWQVSKVFSGERTVEDFATKKERKRSQQFKEKISYSFCD